MISVRDRVKNANRIFYDTVGSSYERLDGRRTGSLKKYIAAQLGIISKKTSCGSILDLGCGNGFVSKIAKDYFIRRYAVDISPKILASIEDDDLIKINSDADSIPIETESIDCVVTFAVLHHCFTFDQMFREIYRVLRKGGIYYSDHDMDALFFSRFKPLLKIYRIFSNQKKHCLSIYRNLSGEIYDCSEFHSKGIQTETISESLLSIGFREVKLDYHWYGLSPLFDGIFSDKIYKRGFAPIVRVTASK